MIQDKDGKEVTIKDILGYLTGTDINDDAKSVIDFAVYKVNDDKTLGDPEYYLVATDAIVTQISFMGMFTMVEVDFRNVGETILNQVLGVVNKFHSDVNSEQMMMISTITSFDENSTHVMSLVNPLICVRGFSVQGEASTLMQLVYATESIGFSINKVDYNQINAEIDREIYEMEASIITKESEVAAQESQPNEFDEMMQDAFGGDFAPDFGGVTTSEERFKGGDGVRVSGYKNRESNKDKSKTVRVGGSSSTKITGYDDEDENEEVK